METLNSNVAADGQNIKATLAALTPQQFDVLKQTATYYRLVRGLRATGWLNLFLGVLTLLWGVLTPYPTIFSTIQTVVGFLIIAQSLWSIFRPSVRGFFALTIILVLCGVWNIFITIYGRFSGLDLWVGFLGVYQLWEAYRTYKDYQRFFETPTAMPTPELIQQYKEIWQTIAHPTPMLAPELLKVKFAPNRYWWNGVLLPNGAVLAHPRQKVLMVTAKPDITLIAENPKRINKEKFDIFVLIDKSSLTGKIYRSSFQQYLQWKGFNDPEAGLTPELARKRLNRKIARWVMIVILILVALFIASLVTFAMQYS